MTRDKLHQHIRNKQSFLCIGLDTDVERLPDHLPKNAKGIVAFNREIIAATKDLCVAYKPNTAFYEALGSEGWSALQETIALIPDSHLCIADAKRGDIGNTSRQYAKAVFEQLGADAITVAPYMGYDSVQPFLDFPGKWTIVLGLTSNAGAQDFQHYGQPPLFEQVLTTTARWGTPDQLMFVVGATQARALTRIRTLTPDHFLLVPGVGAQGGSLEEVFRYGANREIGLLVNASRSILFAGQGKQFATAAREAAQHLQNKMRILMEQ